MTENPTGQGKVSIVIPCYNHGAMLREALASVEEVRNENLLEVIIVDDGSVEVETRKILDELEQEGHCVVRQPNRGSSAARNAGIRLAKGEFILPLDSDNRVRDVYLKEGVSFLKDNPSIGVIYADAEYFGEKSGRWDVPEFNLLSLIRWNFIDVCALYRKALWDEVGGYDEQMPWMGVEDWDFWLRVAANGGTFVHLSKIGFDYRVCADSQIVRTIGFDCRVAREPVDDLMQASPRLAKLIDYIFSKPEMAFYKWVRETDEEVQRLRGQLRVVEASYSYRLGRALLAPPRWLRNLWRRFSLRRCK
jgi:glycosyltransferase involved in cell wall biosynthesis